MLYSVFVNSSFDSESHTPTPQNYIGDSLSREACKQKRVGKKADNLSNLAIQTNSFRHVNPSTSKDSRDRYHFGGELVSLVMFCLSACFPAKEEAVSFQF
uniref:Uncharacterized protein n=1 Tax=Sphaerodactylus townsendi TaxID=933632 RepID=A0ACB8FFY0_9SAUR